MVVSWLRNALSSLGCFGILQLLEPNPLTAQYDSLYAAKDEVFGREPLPAVRRFAEYLAGGRVLDIGGGEGVNAVFLAQAGYQVTVVDMSAVGLEKVRAVAAAKQLSIETTVCDVTKRSIAGMYEGMVCAFMLHHLSVADARSLIAALQQHTTVGGVHVLATFLDQGGLSERNQRSGSGRFYPSGDTLQTLYADWELLEYATKMTTTLAKDRHGNPFTNEMAVLIARKCG